MRYLALALTLPLLACVPADEPVGPSETPTAAERAECEAAGGRIGPGGLLPWTCLFDHDDAGKVCTSSDDCEGACIAEEAGATQGTCAGVSPVFGCRAIFMEPGEPAVMLCID